MKINRKIQVQRIKNKLETSPPATIIRLKDPMNNFPILPLILPVNPIKVT